MVLWGTTGAIAGPLSDRLERFPDWQSKPPVQLVQGDLVYPDWMEGTWEVTSTLKTQVAPLAPDILTPGFEKNKRYLEKPISFQVRFAEEQSPGKLLVPMQAQQGLVSAQKAPVVADREFNGLNIAKAYLGDRKVLSVKVDPTNPNRQITQLRGDRQLVSIVTARGSEMPSPDEFVATEITQQVFRKEPQIYFNEVETTTEYQRVQPPLNAIEGNQVTAIYLSPQDPDYFEAGGKPVALYEYKLELSPVEQEE
ncbi:DUF6816 family protein [Phormidium sp. CCY1219]|jgi:hypothetical protein|uniref:DUF6816 family protein n=1 Tax=Phormidium sp. CCY1219 TaxID=2886104 RepID=UPI003FA71C58